MRSLIALALMLMVPVASAAAAEPVDLAQALERVEQHNPTLRGAVAGAQVAEVGRMRARAAYLPSVTAAGSYTRNSVAADLAFPDFAAGFQLVQGPDGPTMVPLKIDNLEVQKQDQLGMQLQVQQGLIVPTAIPQMGAAKAGARAAQYGTEQLRRELLFATAELYYGIVALSESVKVTEAHVELFEDHLRVAQIAYDAGSAAEISVLRAQMDLQNAQRDLVRARKDLHTNLGQLALLMGRPDADLDILPPADLQELLDGAPPPPAGGWDLDQALAARSDYKAQLARIQASRKTQGAAYAAFLPTVGAGFNYSYQNVKGFTGRNDIWSASVNVSLPLFDRGLRAADVKEAQAQIREAEAALDELELQVQQDLREADLSLVAAATSLQTAREQASLARRSWTAVETSFAAGAASSIEVTDAATNLRSAELSVIAEAVGYMAARLRLQRATGLDHPLAERTL